MPRARFSRLQTGRHVMEGAVAGDRRPDRPGDAPSPPAEPPGGAWSIGTYPNVEPEADEEADT